MEKITEQLSELEDIRQQVDFLNKTARKLLDTSPQNLPRAIALCEMASELASQETRGETPYQTGLVESLANLGEFYIQFANYDLALSFLFKALNLLELVDNPQAAASILNWIGVTYGYLGEYDQALDYYLKAQQIYHQTGNLLAQALLLNKVGQVYLQLEKTDPAYEFLTQSLAILEETGAIDEQAEVLRSLCQVHALRNESQQALSCGLRSASIYRQANNFRGQAQVLLSLGDLFRSVRLYTRLLPGVFSSGAQQLNLNVQTLVNDWGIPNNALDSYQGALELATQVEARYDQITALLRLGETYLEDPIPGLASADRLEQSKGYLLQALELGNQINARQLVFETHRLLAEVLKRQSNFETALAHYEQYHRLREEVFTRESANRLRNLEIVHQVDAARKQAEISRLKNFTLQQEIRQRKAAQWELEQANRKLQEQVADKEQLIADLNAFSHMVAHDLKSPLTNIAVAAGLVKLEMNTLAAASETSQHSENLDRIQWMVSKMNRIINELLTLASVRDEEFYAEPLDMDQLILDVERRLNHLFQEKQAGLIKPTHWPQALGHAPWVEEVWANYISNAIYYGGNPPQVEIGAEVLESLVDLPVIEDQGEEDIVRTPSVMIRFWIRDNGDGIPPEHQQAIFTPFTARKLISQSGQPSSDPMRDQGHGLGLSIVKRIIEKLNGQVGVESSGQPGAGSLFYFTLPAAPPKT